MVWSNGVRYAGSPIDLDTSHVETWERAGGLLGGGGSIAVAPKSGLDIRSQEDMERAAEAYAAAGRSPEQDRAALATCGDGE